MCATQQLCDRLRAQASLRQVDKRLIGYGDTGFGYDRLGGSLRLFDWLCKNLGTDAFGALRCLLALGRRVRFFGLRRLSGFVSFGFGSGLGGQH